MGTHERLLFLEHTRFRVAERLAHNPKCTAELVVRGRELVTRDLIHQAALQIEGGPALLADLDRQSAGALADWWAAIVAFFESPVGKAILDVLVSLVLTLLGL